MSTHTVSRKTRLRRVDFFFERLRHHRGQFFRDVRVHFVPFTPRLPSRIDVEPCPGSKVP